MTAKKLLFNTARTIGSIIMPPAVRKSAIVQNAKQWLLSRLPHDEIYSREYFSDMEVTSAQAARFIADSIVAKFAPKTVIDIGCGTGALLAQLRERGCTVTGIEYSQAALDQCRSRGLNVFRADFERDDVFSLLSDRKFDTVVSLEVAEHLSESIADRYVALLCALSPTVIFSAATPGQGGTDHVNEQPHAYWVAKFRDHQVLPR